MIDNIVEECKNEGNLQVRICFVGYRDIKDGERFRVLPFTDDIDSVRKFIAESKAEGGDDAPEDLQGGLKLALLQDWTQEASKRVFVVCDAPCHGKQYHDTSDNYPNGSPDELVLEHLMQDFCRKEIEFQVLQLDKSCTKMIQVMKESHEMLEVTDMTKPAEVTESLKKLKSTINPTSGSVDAVRERYGCEMVRGAVKQVRLKQMVVRAFQSNLKEQAAIRIQRKFRARKANEKA